ncbi:cytochrome c family protein [Devosia ginsengisoli]|uniref:c-type cytochrome n=1 Tax=Devosia ginsengisoli TaxID=400770 RepID=UPI0026F1F9C9|nr:hypothetical protein [Devosia ginsengisoli]MCR6671513.1 hypothetical protein [Devosia ginsengisoli]
MKVMALGLVAVALMAAPAFAQGDAAAGETVFESASRAMRSAKAPRTRSGPRELNNLFGRVAGTHADFKYSKQMVDAGAGGLVWTSETLHEFLTKPRDFVKGTKMSFPGLKKQEEVDNLVAYLMTFQTDPVPEAAAPPRSKPLRPIGFSFRTAPSMRGRRRFRPTTLFQWASRGDRCDILLAYRMCPIVLS